MVVVKQVALLLLGAVIAGAMVVLGIWQLDVYRAQGEQTAAARAAAPPVPLARVARAGAPLGDGLGRTVTFSGSYDAQLQLLVPSPGGGPSRVLTGFTLPDGSVVAVVRGTVPPTSTTALTPPTGQLEQTGVLLPSESAGQDTSTTLTSVQLAALAQRWSPPLVPAFVTLSPAESAGQHLGAAPVALPESRGRLRNGAYALQWWVFAAFALALALKMARDLGKPDDEVVGALAED